MDHLENITRYVRRLILTATTEAGSGHPTSCLSAVEIVTELFFDGFFHFNFRDNTLETNDRFILSKGHAAPLLYACYVVLGLISENDLKQLRKFDSPLEGHPSVRFPYVEVATGSLGQGLSIGIGMALAAQRQDIKNHIFVLLGDGEMEEGSNWEAIQIASHYNLGNIVGIIDLSQLEQVGETMIAGTKENKASILKQRIESFGWRACIVDGHSLPELKETFEKVANESNQPTMIIAKTIKGKGVSFLEGMANWHGKTLNKEQLQQALNEIGQTSSVRAHCLLPTLKHDGTKKELAINDELPEYVVGQVVAVREAYGVGLVKARLKDSTILSLDAGVSNSTHALDFKHIYPGDYYEMYIAEQNMIGVGVGLAKRGYVPFLSTFGAFLTRAHDQLRMASYSDANIKCVGSHIGVSIGEDGPSQMGLEDIALFRSLYNSCVLYPSDAVSCEKIIVQAAAHRGLAYIRLTRASLPVLYSENENFKIGGSKVLRESENDTVVVFSAGITLHEALKVYENLIRDGIAICIVDVFSVKPLDIKTIREKAIDCQRVIVVEDHYPEGGLGEAIMSELIGLPIQFKHLAVSKKPQSGTMGELLDYEEISAQAIEKAIGDMH